MPADAYFYIPLIQQNMLTEIFDWNWGWDGGVEL